MNIIKLGIFGDSKYFQSELVLLSKIVRFPWKEGSEQRKNQKLLFINRSNTLDKLHLEKIKSKPFLMPSNDFPNQKTTSGVKI